MVTISSTLTLKSYHRTKLLWHNLHIHQYLYFMAFALQVGVNFSYALFCIQCHSQPCLMHLKRVLSMYRIVFFTCYKNSVLVLVTVRHVTIRNVPKTYCSEGSNRWNSVWMLHPVLTVVFKSSNKELSVHQKHIFLRIKSQRDLNWKFNDVSKTLL